MNTKKKIPVIDNDLIDLNNNFYGSTAIVSNSIPVGVGLAYSIKINKQKNLCQTPTFNQKHIKKTTPQRKKTLALRLIEFLVFLQLRQFPLMHYPLFLHSHHSL